MVWNDRMLTTLRQGVRGGKWHTLSDKVYRMDNLLMAARRVIANRGAAGVDHVDTHAFESRQLEEVKRLEAALSEDTYVPQVIRRTWIPKPGSSEDRPLGIPTVRDRVVQTALLHVLEPIFDITFHERSYGFRHGRGCHHALERVEELLNAGYVYVVDADLKSYFDTIPHANLMARVKDHVSDSRILRWIEMFLKQGIMEDLAVWTPETGTPQGAVLSPLLANIYLNPLDHLLSESGFEVVRYADDFVILCRSAAEAHQALTLVQTWVVENGLTLHPTKTRIAEAGSDDGFQFLGYWFKKGRIREPRPKSRGNLRSTLRQRTRRTRGDSLPAIIADVNCVLRGWFAYFRHSFWNVFTDIDSWLRRRLRSLLRKRRKRRGMAKAGDNVRWPDRFFADHGLFSLHTAHVQLCESSLR